MQGEEGYLEGNNQNIIKISFWMILVGNSFLLYYTLQYVFFHNKV